MAPFLSPDHGDPGSDRVGAGSVGGSESQLEQRLLRDGRQVIARGALICAECELPLPGRPAMSASHVVHCGWCGHRAPARDLLRPGVDGPAASRVELVARVR